MLLVTVLWLSFVSCSSGPFAFFQSPTNTSQGQNRDFFVEGGVLRGYSGNATNVTIPSNVTVIGMTAFFGKSNITNISIPASVDSVSSLAFQGCSNLTSITVNTQNKFFSSVDGVLFNKDITALVIYPAGKRERTYTIPEGITSIGANAFEGCTSLTSITIPTSVTSIGTRAFGSCIGLTNITIPSSVTSIGSGAFRLCSNLRTVVISRNTTIGNDAFSETAQITYSD